MKSLFKEIEKKLFWKNRKRIIIINEKEFDLYDRDGKSRVLKHYADDVSKDSWFKFYRLSYFQTIKSLKGRDSGIHDSTYPENIIREIQEQNEYIAIVAINPDDLMDGWLYNFLKSMYSKYVVIYHGWIYDLTLAQYNLIESVTDNIEFEINGGLL